MGAQLRIRLWRRLQPASHDSPPPPPPTALGTACTTTLCGTPPSGPGDTPGAADLIPCASSRPRPCKTRVKPRRQPLQQSHPRRPHEVGPDHEELLRGGVVDPDLEFVPHGNPGLRETLVRFVCAAKAEEGGGDAPFGTGHGGASGRRHAPRGTVRRVVAPLRGPGQSPVLLFACCVGSLRSVGRCGRCSCWCRFRVRRAQ